MSVHISPEGGIYFNGLQFKMRRCFGNGMWSVLLRENGKWESVFLVCSVYTPFQWVSEFIHSNADTVSGFRRSILNKTHPR